jgi:DNA-binding MarR family transcriptional regulator
MARSAHVTKQTMGALVDHLERTGYVERVVDPDDGRASRIRFTRRGEAFAKEARAFSRRIEADLDALLGPRRVEELRTALRMIHEEYGSGGRPPR